MILEKVRAACERYALLKGADTVWVACSGGADSMALLQALRELQEEYGITVCAAHFHHGIRGAEADRDAQFVRRFCADRGIICEIGYGNAPDYAAKNKVSLETAARELRYAFLEKTANGGRIATAHQADDNLETVLFRLARGTALDGLCGIPPVRGSIIRPLLLCSRAETEAFCRSRGIAYMTDSTNLKDNCTRNLLRHRVTEPLRQIFPNAAVAAGRMCDSLRADGAALNAAADAAFRAAALPNGGLSAEVLCGCEPAIAVRLLRRKMAENGIAADAAHLTEILALLKKGGRCSLPGGYAAVVKNGALFFEKNALADLRFSVSWQILTPGTDVVLKNVYKKLFTYRLDYDKIKGKINIRTRLPGDRFCLHRSAGTKTLKKLYNEFHIPAAARKNLPVLVDAIGIVCIAGIGTAERCKPDKATQRILQVQITVCEGEYD